MALKILIRGLKKYCPQCGKIKIYRTWGVLHDKCPNCEFPLLKREGSCWFFMYLSTAAITGVFIILMFLIKPENLTLWRWIFALAALITIAGSIPQRKGIAIAIDYLIEKKLDHPSLD